VRVLSRADRSDVGGVAGRARSTTLVVIYIERRTLMSNSSQGEGWWLASDGKWYPPQVQQPPSPQPTTPPSLGHHAAEAPARLGKYTSLPPEQAPVMLVQLLSGQGAVITTHTSTSITGVVNTTNKPSCIVATILFFIFIIPAIIYMIAASKNTSDPFSLAFRPDGAGTRINGNGQGRGLAAINWAVDQLPR
jgi:hypothetical protein